MLALLISGASSRNRPRAPPPAQIPPSPLAAPPSPAQRISALESSAPKRPWPSRQWPVIQLGCGLGNRLFTMAKEIHVSEARNYTTTFVWSPDVNKFSDEAEIHQSRSTSFDDLFSYPESTHWQVVQWKSAGTSELQYGVRDPETRWFPHLRNANVTRGGQSTALPLMTIGTKIGFDHRKQRGEAVACCVCPKVDWQCNSWLGTLRPASSLQPALDALRQRLGVDEGAAPKILHLRNVDKEGWDFNNASTSLSQTPSRVHDLLRLTNFSYAAVEHADDARLLRKLSPTIMLQEDFRKVEYRRETLDGHRTSVFELFALAMVRDYHDMISTFQLSSFLQLARCLRRPGENASTYHVRSLLPVPTSSFRCPPRIHTTCPV